MGEIPFILVISLKSRHRSHKSKSCLSFTNAEKNKIWDQSRSTCRSFPIQTKNRLQSKLLLESVCLPEKNQTISQLNFEGISYF